MLRKIQEILLRKIQFSQKNVAHFTVFAKYKSDLILSRKIQHKNVTHNTNSLKIGCMLEYHSLQIIVCITFLGKGTYEIRLKTIFGFFLKKYTVCPGVLCMGVECGRQKCQNSISL